MNNEGSGWDSARDRVDARGNDALNYRTSAKAPPRTLSVRNHSVAFAVIFTLFTSVFVVVGLFLDALAIAADGSVGSHVLFGVMGLAFTVIGGLGTWSMSRAFRARTRLTIDGTRMLIELSNGDKRELALEEFTGAEVFEDDGDESKVYCTRLRAKGGVIPLDDLKYSSRGHYEKTVAAIEQFLATSRD